MLHNPQWNISGCLGTSSNQKGTGVDVRASVSSATDCSATSITQVASNDRTAHRRGPRRTTIDANNQPPVGKCRTTATGASPCVTSALSISSRWMPQRYIGSCRCACSPERQRCRPRCGRCPWSAPPRCCPDFRCIGLDRPLPCHGEAALKPRRVTSCAWPWHSTPRYRLMRITR